MVAIGHAAGLWPTVRGVFGSGPAPHEPFWGVRMHSTGISAYLRQFDCCFVHLGHKPSDLFCPTEVASLGIVGCGLRTHSAPVVSVSLRFEIA